MKIVIFAREKRDPVLKNLFFWFKNTGHDASILFTDDIFNQYKLKFHSGNPINQFQIELEDGRRISEDNVDLFFLRHDPIKSTTGMDDTQKFRAVEYNAFISFFCAKLKKANKVIGYCPQLSTNKLFQLDTAKSVGLLTPVTLVTNKESNVNLFRSKQSLITKAIQGIFIAKTKGGYITNYTSRIEDSDEIGDIDLTLYQPEIKKHVELRIYFLIDEFFCIASKSDSFDTEIDIRIIMAHKEVEYYEYNLPSEIKNKLTLLKDELGIDTFSADIIVTDRSEYFVIDINPHGQISMLAQTKIKNLEKRIAEKIINYGKRSEGI